MEFEEALEKILAKDAHELTDGDRDFIRARAGYLSEEARKKFAKELKGVKIEEVKEDVPEEEEE